MAKNGLKGNEDPAKMAENLKKMEDTRQNDINQAKLERDKHYADMQKTVTTMQDGYEEADKFYQNKSSEFDDQLTNIQDELLSLQGDTDASAGSGPRM